MPVKKQTKQTKRTKQTKPNEQNNTPGKLAELVLKKKLGMT